MGVRVTPSARRDLFDAVARLRRLDPDRAARFISQTERRLTDTSTDLEGVPELGSARHSAAAGDGHRFYLSERTSGTWLIAVWPEPELRGDEHGEDINR